MSLSRRRLFGMAAGGAVAVTAGAVVVASVADHVPQAETSAADLVRAQQAGLLSHAEAMRRLGVRDSGYMHAQMMAADEANARRLGLPTHVWQRLSAMDRAVLLS